MSSLSSSPSRVLHASYSPPTPPEPRTIRVTIVIYVLDHADPLVQAMWLPIGQPFRLRDSFWFQQAVPGDHRREMHLWQLKFEDWATVNRDEVQISVSEKSSTFILRLPHVWHCEGLGREILAREEFRLRYFGMLPPPVRERCDIRVPRLDKLGDDYVVVVYPALLAAPQTFVIRLDLDGLIAIWDYPLLARACYGCDTRKDAVDIGIRVWNPQRAQFDFYDARAPVYAVAGYNFVIIRNEYNRYAPGLGKYITQLETEHLQQAFATNIPFADPTRTPIARPALSKYLKREVTCDPIAHEERKKKNQIQYDGHSDDEQSVVAGYSDSAAKGDGTVEGETGGAEGPQD